MLHPTRSMLFGELPPVSQSSHAFFYVFWKAPDGQVCAGRRGRLQISHAGSIKTANQNRMEGPYASRKISAATAPSSRFPSPSTTAFQILVRLEVVPSRSR